MAACENDENFFKTILLHFLRTSSPCLVVMKRLSCRRDASEKRAVGRLSLLCCTVCKEWGNLTDHVFLHCWWKGIWMGGLLFLCERFARSWPFSWVVWVHRNRKISEDKLRFLSSLLASMSTELKDSSPQFF